MTFLLTRLARASVVLFAAAALLPVPAQAMSIKTMLLRYHWVAGSHFSQIETDTSTVSGKLTPSFGPPSPALAIQRVTTTETVRKVYADGSGLVRLTFTGVSTTANGKKTVYQLRGYAIDQRISPRGVLISQRILGKLPSTSSLPGEVTGTIPSLYPVTAATAGTVWHQTESTGALPGSALRKIGITYRVLALGSAHGQPTVKIGMAIDQPMHVTGKMGTLSGVYTAKGTETVVVATGVPVGIAHIVLTVKFTITGPLTHGTLHSTVDEVVKPVP